MFTGQGMGQGPRTLALRASQGRVQGEPTGRAIIVIAHGSVLNVHMEAF